ncbi:hypothetical protein FBEOM_5467 [Fusarium beomiforme]|uniref:Uncharacterized protein n=1 Tax=Fusarium beomiforme TaxID=44412 RepID=A0A9P5AL61_9HYPO|nr:hypothetical protein FBEOM_5467 [Fusarium beomiforme]
MLTISLIISLVSLSFGKEMIKDHCKKCAIQDLPILDQFPWPDFLDNTGIDPLAYLDHQDFDTPEILACTMASSPNPRHSNVTNKTSDLGPTDSPVQRR